MVFKLAAPMALTEPSKAFRASTVCAGAVPANRMKSPMRMHSFRAIPFPHSQKINLRTEDLDFCFDIPDGHFYTPEDLPAEPNCSSSGNFRVWAAGGLGQSARREPRLRALAANELYRGEEKRKMRHSERPKSKIPEEIKMSVEENVQ